MSKEELLKLLKENLTVEVKHQQETEWVNGEIKVTILFDGETICEGYDYVFGG